MPKYKNNETATNQSTSYQEIMERRDKTSIVQWRTKYFEKNEDLPVNTIQHVWSHGDKYYKLANKYYGDIECWWVIAFFNKAPTEAHLNYGDVIYIPTPLETAKALFGEQ